MSNNQLSNAIIDERVEKGLTTVEANEIREKIGQNKLPEKKPRSAFNIFMAQFKNPLIYIITIAAIISIILGQYEDALIIGVVIAIDCVVGFLQEYKAEKTMTVLQGLLKPTAYVLRDGNVSELDITEIVPGDLVMLRSGDKVSADGLVTESVTLSVNEAILTGESEPIMKKLGDRAFMGTIVQSGRGFMKVTETGVNTQLGKIATSLTEIKKEITPLQVRLDNFGKTLTYMVILICIGILATGIIMRFDLLEMIRLSVVLATAAIPEGLLIAVTMILVIGMRSILRRKGLVKKLLAVETLGSVSTICSDKTGTLTEGIMQVVRTNFQFEQLALYTMSLCNNQEDALEISLWNYVKTSKENPEEITEKFKREYEIPFSSENKYMLVTCKIDNIETGLMKGAPDVVMNLCTLSQGEKEKITIQLEEWAGSGLRLLGVAHKSGNNPRNLQNYTWNGFIGIEDPIRESVKDAISLCRKAGVKIKMITGDYRKTAEKVAMNLGLAVSADQVLEGVDLEKISESELATIVKNIVIFCRVSPHHKMKIVNALQMCGEITAMIGDGVNDAPALKKANIGVSVGNGTDVAQETASLVLMDNNFGTLVSCVEEGRVVYDNIKKVVAYVLSNSFAEIFIIFGAFILGWPTPLTVGQILWIHLICDGPSDIALGFERGEKGIMELPPKNLNENILDNKGKVLICFISIISGLICLLLFYYFWQNHNEGLGRTIVFTVLGIQELIYIFSYRSLRISIFKSGKIYANKALVFSVILGIGTMLIGLYVPGINTALDVVPLNGLNWLIVITISFTMLAIVEIVKFADRRIRGTELQQVFKIVKRTQAKIPEINNLHNISVDIMRDKILLQFHYGIPAETPLYAAHEMATNIEHQIEEEFPLNLRRNLEIISHLEPAKLPPAKVHSHSFRPTHEETKLKIQEAMEKVSGVLKWDHLEVIEEDRDISISVKIYLNRDTNVSQTHHLTEDVEAEIRRLLPDLKRCNIHTEPID